MTKRLVDVAGDACTVRTNMNVNCGGIYGTQGALATVRGTVRRSKTVCTVLQVQLGVQHKGRYS